MRPFAAKAPLLWTLPERSALTNLIPLPVTCNLHCADSDLCATESGVQRVVYRCAVDYGEAQGPPKCSFGYLVPDEEAQVPGNFEATHPLEGKGCGLTIFYCATLVFILSALHLPRERP